MAKKASKTSTVKVGNTTIKNATPADKENIALAEKSVATTKADEVPEAKSTVPAQKAAAKEQFAKGDARVEPQSRIDARAADKLSPEKLAIAQADNAASLAAKGY